MHARRNRQVGRGLDEGVRLVEVVDARRDRRAPACAVGAGSEIRQDVGEPFSVASGIRTMRPIQRPRPLPARSVPRWGAAMNTTRSTCGNGSKLEHVPNSLSGCVPVAVSSWTFSATRRSHRVSPDEDTIRRAMMPPMLCPTITIPREARFFAVRVEVPHGIAQRLPDRFVVQRDRHVGGVVELPDLKMLAAALRRP